MRGALLVLQRGTPSGLPTTRLLAQHRQPVVAVAEWKPSLMLLLEVESQLLRPKLADEVPSRTGFHVSDTILLKIAWPLVAPLDLVVLSDLEVLLLVVASRAVPQRLRQVQL